MLETTSNDFEVAAAQQDAVRETAPRRRPVAPRPVMVIIPAMQLLALLLLPFLNRDASGLLITQMAVAMLILLGYIDLLTLKVPNALVYPSIAFVLAGTTIVDSSLGLEALIGGAGCLGMMFAIALVGRGAMGMGDVKYGCLVGCILGLRFGLVALASGFALGALLAVLLLVLRIRSRKDSVPLSPFLTVGALLWMFFVGPII